MAGLPGRRAWVKVGPPLSCSGPSFGSPERLGLQLPSWMRLFTLVAMMWKLAQSPSPAPLAIMVLRRFSVSLLAMALSRLAEFPLNVQLVMEIVNDLSAVQELHCAGRQC